MLRMKPKSVIPAAAALLALLAAAAPASAEIIFLTSGRTLSVKGHRVDGDVIVLTLRSGGEVTCSRSVIEKIEGDEVPYQDPENAATQERSADDAQDLSLLDGTP